MARQHILPPGPWRAEGNKVKFTDHGNWHTIATVGHKKTTDEANRNTALLFSASQDLLASLESAISQLQEDFNEAASMNMSQQWIDNIDTTIQSCNNAIAKAKGEE